ncbi:hypothetical protein [Rhizobium leguminosarum]|uniref:hypothetical protein n=1 Tax=Rhizobium leguminosarum TaxID=384 RepID=UPI001DE77866|nr:hypothetical protein [Rhizobium leguminosarum]MBP2449900.1 hypothetical protein [Rhizobium leguminosarum]
MISSLNIHTPAPSIKVKAWLRGDGISNFQLGKIYILEFFSTTCSGCGPALARQPIWKGVALLEDDLMRGTVMFALRSSGVLLSRYAREFGVPFEKYFPRELEILKETDLVFISKSLTRKGFNDIRILPAAW